MDSDATVETGIANTSRAIWEMTRYLKEFIFHHIKMSKYSTSGSSEGSNKYLSNEALLPLPLELETRDEAILWLGGATTPSKIWKKKKRIYIYIYIYRC